jgi:hypothetical protein
MKFMCRGTLAIVPLLVIFLPKSLWAQTTASGGLTGTVIDATNRVVPDATVELRNTANGTQKRRLMLTVAIFSRSYPPATMSLR